MGRLLLILQFKRVFYPLQKILEAIFIVWFVEGGGGGVNFESLCHCVRAPLFVYEYFSMNESFRCGIRAIVYRSAQTDKGCSNLGVRILLLRCCHKNLHLLRCAHQLSTVLPSQLPGGHCFFVVCHCVCAECRSFIQPSVIFFSPFFSFITITCMYNFYKLHCWNMTRSLLCKLTTSLFGSPCHSYALLKPCKL